MKYFLKNNIKIFLLMKNMLKYVFLLIICTINYEVGCRQINRIVNIPLDERFTTRIAFLNLAKITPYQIISLPK